MRSGLRGWLSTHAPALLTASRVAKITLASVRAQPARRGKIATFVGITGSCGKSTTTQLIGALLDDGSSAVAVSTRNTDIAMLRQLGSLGTRVDFYVQEVAGHAPGHIARLMPILRPDVAVVTAIGDDHFGAFRNSAPPAQGDETMPHRLRRAIAIEKGALVAAVGRDGFACLNADDNLVRTMAERTAGRVLLFGTRSEADVRAENVTARWPGRLAFELVIGERRWSVQTRFVGSIMLTNILGALAVIHALGRSVDAAIARLATIDAFPGRMNVVDGDFGHSFVCDTIKAPLWSVQRLIADFPSLGGPLVFVLGEVSDSRNDKSATYRKLLRESAAAADHVIGFGPVASSAKKVRDGGFVNVTAASSQAELDALLSQLPPSLVILKSNKLTPIRPLLRT